MSGISQFDRKFFDPGKPISFIGSGSMGGKAQGLVHINNFLNSAFNKDDFPEIEVNIPTLTVIRTDVFDNFMAANDLYEIAHSAAPDDRIAHAFQKANLPFEILGDLRALVEEVHSPLAVRSSSMLEDAIHEPFAGIYSTKMTPNNQPDADSRFRKLVEAIKFVYASTFFKDAKDYMKVSKHQIGDEKMAVIIQEVVGQRHGERFYPEVSGIARSYNYYPMGRAKPEDGVVDLALGLGKTIVDGGVSWAYSPAWPKISPPFNSIGEMLKYTQKVFWAVNMGKPPAYDPIKETEYLVLENLTTAETDGVLQHIASTVDRNSGRLVMGTGADGPRVLTFAPILTLKDIPFNNLIKSLLKLCADVLNTPVEIEFAMTFSKDAPHRFGFLQVRPMVISTDNVHLDLSALSADNVLIASEHVLGNGVIDDIQDIVYVKPDSFNLKQTHLIAQELGAINEKLVSENLPYLLIGFGRWGSSDPWLGIPVKWSQISGAKVIVETTLENIHIDLSQGSHFFHNLTSFNVSYFSLSPTSKNKIDWYWLQSLPSQEDRDLIRHVKISPSLTIKIDGQNGRGVIYKP